MHKGAEFQENDLWYGWDADTEKYWAWCDDKDDWVEWINPDGDNKATDTIGVTNGIPGLEDDIYYINNEDSYYYKGGLIEYDAEWKAFYYYTNPEDPDQYEWLDGEIDFDKAVEVSTIDMMYAMMDGSYVEEAPPAFLSPSRAIIGTIKLEDDDEFNLEDEKPDLYYDTTQECYFYLDYQVHHKKKTNKYYVIDRLRKEAVPIPTEHAEAIQAGSVPIWPVVLEEGPPLEEAEAEEDQETQPSSPEAAIKKPVIPVPAAIPAGTLFKMKENDLLIYNRGARMLTDEESTSLYNEELRDVFVMSKWGEYLVGRCRRTFGMLINNEVNVKDILPRLPELIGLVQHLNSVQLLMIWKHNCSVTMWAEASDEPIRNFAFKIERSVSFNVVARCVMRGYNIEEGAMAIFKRKYSPKETNRIELVEKTQEFMRNYDETHVKNMGRAIILIHGMACAEPKLMEYLKSNPWWSLPTKEGEKKESRVFYNFKTLQAHQAGDITVPQSSLKLVCKWEGATNSNGLFVCKA